MSSFAPEVTSGMRQPRSVRMEEARKAAAESPAPRAVPASVPGVTVYVARDRRYRVQITAPQTLILSDGRKQDGGRMLVAQFDEGVYRNTERNPATHKLIDETLQSNPYFGAFGSTAHFWLASDQQAKVEAGRIKSALNTLSTLPKEAVEQFIGELRQGSAEDHELTPATK